MDSAQRIRVVDSHTGGEPTRVVLSAGPDLGSGPLAERARRLRVSHDHFRSAVVNEPRGSDVLVGALLTEPHEPDCDLGVVFFNNVGVLGMCGHGTIGLVATLAHLGRTKPGDLRIDTPVGPVIATLRIDGSVSVANVPSRRTLKGATLDVPGHGKVSGDVAWGGNWFFLCEDHGLQVEPSNVELLTDLAWRIRVELPRAGITGDDGAEIDHVELLAPSTTANSRNFVLCPGKAYDRSPCGTGTSAKLACLAADGKLAEGEIWRQESVIGSIFEASYRRLPDGSIAPTVTGRAFITAEADLILDPADPFQSGIPAR